MKRKPATNRSLSQPWTGGLSPEHDFPQQNAPQEDSLGQNPQHLGSPCQLSLHLPSLPQLLSRLLQANLGHFPTPLQLLPRLGETTGSAGHTGCAGYTGHTGSAGHTRLYIKRDDLTGLGMGGNKTRSLRFLLGDAISKGADTIITAGGLQSNLCSLTAAGCAKLGLRCILIHNDHDPAVLQGNMLLNSLSGAESHFIGKTDEDTRALAMEKLAEELRQEGSHPYIIHNGASTPLGAMGYAAAALELYKQSQEAGVELRHIGMVGAMGGTASGFVFGTALLGAPFHVHVISVEYPKAHLRSILDGLVQGIAELLSCPVPNIEDVMTIYDEYLGEGYAAPTQASRQALLDLARYEGLFAENVYTSKTLAGLLDLIRTGRIPSDERACFVHTGGLGSLFAQTNNVSW